MIDERANECLVCLSPYEHCTCGQAYRIDWQSRALAAEAEVERLKAELEKPQIKMMPAVKSEIVYSED